jgi:hypothetical protein
MIDPNAMSQGIAGAMPQAGGGMPQIAAADPQRRPQGTVSKDLLDALAAAKLLREKQAAQNQLMLSMENDPQTVVAKNQGELEKRSLDEVARGVSGVLQTKNKNARKRMNAIASGQRKGRRPQSTGIQTAGIASNRRPNMMSFAQGGIVGEPQEFNPGGLVLGGLASLGRTALPYIGRGIAGLGKKFFTRPKPPRKVNVPAVRTPNLPATTTGKVPQPGFAGAAVLAGGLPTVLQNYFNDRNQMSPQDAADSVKKMSEQGPTFTPKTPDPTVVAPTDDKQSYRDKMSDVYTALGARGLSGYAVNKRIIEEGKREAATKEAEVEIKKRTAELSGDYQRMIVAERGINNATRMLIQIRTALQEAIAEDAGVLEGQALLRKAGDNKKKIMAAQAVLKEAQKKAEENFQNTDNGKELIARMEALKEAIAKYEGMFPGGVDTTPLLPEDALLDKYNIDG